MAQSKIEWTELTLIQQPDAIKDHRAVNFVMPKLWQDV